MANLVSPREDLDAPAIRSRLRNLMRTSLEQLETLEAASDAQIDDWVCVIFDSMTTPGRFYHGVTHIFDLTDGMTDPICILAVLFHDVVYLTIDKELSEVQAQLLAATNHDHSHMVQRVFAMTPDSRCNEFLSAMIAVSVLQNTLSFEDCVRITACIEATIPFRRNDPMERLYERLEGLLLEDTREAVVQQAVQVSHRDVGSFCSPDPYVFLESSWSLIPEWRPKIVTLHDWLDALRMMQGLYQKMDVTFIFPTFRGYPQDMDDKLDRTRSNLRIVGHYLRARIAAVELLLQSGVTSWEDVRRVEDSFRVEEKAKYNCQVEELLAKGRRRSYLWDPAQAPLAAHLCPYTYDDEAEMPSEVAEEVKARIQGCLSS